jgi:hypothetical protein
VNVLASGDAEEVLTVWDDALTLMLGAEDLDGMATALYTVGGPVKMDALFEAYMAAAGTGSHRLDPAYSGSDPEHDQAAGLSSALEALADLGVVELGTDEAAGGLTVTLSRLGIWGVHRRLRAQGWHVPVLGGGARGDAAALLATLASCDVEDGEAEIAAWLAARPRTGAARELVEAAGRGSPGMRGAGFAVLDRIGARRWTTRCCTPMRPSGCMSTARMPTWGPATGRGCWWIWERGCWKKQIPGMWWRNCSPTFRRRRRPNSWPACGRSATRL